MLNVFLESLTLDDITNGKIILIDKPIEWSKCVKDKSIDLGKKGSKKLNTDSKLTDWVKKKLGK